jgi:DNA-binding transcriptional LysR family regulator
MIASPTDLKYFADVAKTGNLSRSAERLGISQPSVSLALQRLEHEVGAQLFIRSKRGVELTQAGKQFNSHVADLLHSWDSITAKAQASETEIQGNYTFGIHTSMALNLLSGFLPQLIAENPKLNINLTHDISRKITEGIISMKLDMGVAVNPVAHPDLIITPLLKGEVTFWRTDTPITPTLDPSNDQAVLIADSSLIRSQTLIKDYQALGFKFSRIIESNNLEVIADLTAHGCGIGILPVNVAKRAKHKLIRIKKAPKFHDDHSFVYRMENKNLRTVQVISKALQTFAKTL